MSPQNLVREARKLGINTLCLTDINNTSAVFDFIRYCKDAGITPLVGIEFRHPDSLPFIAIAKNKQGFYEINNYLSHTPIERTTGPPR